MECRLWGTDHQDAYRNLPVKEPQDAYTILQTPTGPTLWLHCALMFGSIGSVWAYGRASDFLTWMMRCLLITPCLHYVDDFAGLEEDEHALDVFIKLHEIAKVLGIRFKENLRKNAKYKVSS